MSGYIFPDEYNEDNCALVAVPIAIIPFFRRQAELLQSRSTWNDRESWWKGYQVGAWIEEMLMSGCIKQLIASQDRIYRLLDTALNGTEYTIEPPVFPATESTVTPALPLAPPYQAPHQLAPPDNYGLRTRLERLINLTDNLATGNQTGSNPALSTANLQNVEGLRTTLREMQGILDAGWFGLGGEPATIANVVEALRIGSVDDASDLDDALAALSAASSVASIFDVVRGLLTDTVGKSLEGGILVTLIAASIANAATQGVLSGQLDRIIAALDGGAMLPPDSNVLETLQNINHNVDEVEDLLR